MFKTTQAYQSYCERGAMLSVGMKYETQTEVIEATTAKAMKSGTHEVFATPALVALCEEASVAAIAPGLEPGQATVGIEITLKHTAPTPLGMHVRAQSTLIAIEGRVLTFSCEAFDEHEQIASATHKRCIVDANKFQQKANAKLHA